MTKIADVEILVLGERGFGHRVKVASLTGRNDEQYLRAFKVAKVALIAGAGSTYAFTWQNPEDNKIIIRGVIVYITVASTLAATLDIDVAPSAADTGNTIFNGLALNTAAPVVYSSHNVGDTGVAGNEKPHIVDENGGTNDWITGLETSGNSMAALVGNVYIIYTEV